MEPQNRISEIEEELRSLERRRHVLLGEMQKLRRELAHATAARCGRMIFSTRHTRAKPRTRSKRRPFFRA
jgi:hypothetical protein